MRKCKVILNSKSSGGESIMLADGVAYEEYGETVVSFDNAEGYSKVFTKVVLGKDIVSIVKSGEISTVMTFEKDKNGSAEINTDIGKMIFPFHTTNLQKKITEKEITLNLTYQSSESNASENFSVELICNYID